MRKPTNTRVTQTAAQHGYPATDYSFQPDEWVYAAENGTISDVTLKAGACGKRIILTAGNVQYYMCHFQDVAVKVGQKVKEGQKLGIMGETGETNGRHLHLVIIVNGQRVADPDAWLNQQIAKEKKVGKPTREDVSQDYAKVGRKASVANQILHSTKGTHKSLHTGLMKDFWKYGYGKQIKDLEKQLKNVKNALKKAENKPPKEIIKEVEKIVEVPVGGIDEQTKADISAIKSIVEWIKNKLSSIFK